MKIVKLKKYDYLYLLQNHTDDALAKLSDFISEDLRYDSHVLDEIFKHKNSHKSTNRFLIEKNENEITIHDSFYYFDLEDENGDMRYIKIDINTLYKLAKQFREMAKHNPPALIFVQEEESFKIIDQIAIPIQHNKKYLNSINQSYYLDTFNLYNQQSRNFVIFEKEKYYHRDNNRLNQYLSLLCQLFDNEVTLLPEIKSELLNPQSRGLIGNFTDITKNGDQIIIEPLYVSDPSKYRITIGKDNLLELIDTWNTLTEHKVPYLIVKKENDKVIMYAGQKEDIVDNNSGMIYG